MNTLYLGVIFLYGMVVRRASKIYLAIHCRRDNPDQ
jgi:hypothetical protein